jgi:hypothetical protein
VSHGSDPVFFLDRNFGRKTVAAALREAGFRIEVQDDHFTQDTRDEVWLSDVGKRGWFVLTRDERIRYRRLEQEAVHRFRVGMFLLVHWKGSTGPTMAAALIKAKAAIMRFASKQRRPFIAKVYSDGRVSVWLPFSEG